MNILSKYKQSDYIFVDFIKQHTDGSVKDIAPGLISANKKLHVLKIEFSHFKDVLMGRKKAELRFNDRDFQVNDVITFDVLEEARWKSPLYIITHVLKDDKYLLPNYVMLSIREMAMARLIEAVSILSEVIGDLEETIKKQEENQEKYFKVKQ
jgi:hypothetical protein